MMGNGIMSGAVLSWVAIVTELSSAIILYNNRNITLTMSNGTVTMTNSQNKGADMVFVRGSRYQGVYRTPYGSLDMAVFPSVVSYRVGPDSGEINLSYQLDFDGQYASDHELHILYAEKTGKRNPAS